MKKSLIHLAALACLASLAACGGGGDSHLTVTVQQPAADMPAAPDVTDVTITPPDVVVEVVVIPGAPGVAIPIPPVPLPEKAPHTNNGNHYGHDKDKGKP